MFTVGCLEFFSKDAYLMLLIKIASVPSIYSVPSAFQVYVMFPIFNVHNELLWLIISITQKEKNKPQIKDRWCARSPQSDSEVLVPSTAPSAPG